MEQQLEEVQSYFSDEGFREHIDDVLSNYLEKGPCQFTIYQKNALPICAAYFAVQAQQGEGQQVSLMELRNRFFKKAEIDDLLVTAHEFSQRLRGDAVAEQISTRLESLKRNHRLFTKLLVVFDHFCQPYERITVQKISWLMFLLAKENLSKDHEDIEKCAYLLHYICTIVVRRITRSQNPEGEKLGEESQLEQERSEKISDQVNNLLLKGKLETAKMAEFKGEFNVAMEELIAQIVKREKQEDTGKEQQDSEGNNSNNQSDENEVKNQTNNPNSTHSSEGLEKINSIESLLTSLNSSDSSAQLLEILEKICRTCESLRDEQDFLLRDEFLVTILSTPKPSNSNRSTHLQPPGITLDHQEAKYATNSHLDSNEKKVPRRNLIFSDEGPNVHLNSKLADIDRPAASPLPPSQLGLFQQPVLPKTPHPDNQLFKMPYARSGQQQQQHQQQHTMNLLPPSTPYSTALDNFKWINMYSKSDSTKRIDELMARIDRDYKEKILAHIQDVSREVYFNSKKKNDSVPASSPAQNDVENKVAKTTYLFLNVLERMIMEEDQRNCKESQLIQLLENKNFVSALLANCIMTMCFVREIKGITLDLLLKECQITSLDFWRVISNFAKFDKHMPEAIRENLFNLERQILLYNIWDEKDEFIQSALESFQSDSATKNQNYDKVLCRRLISHSATRVKEMCRVLNLNEEIQERVWDALLYIYRHQIPLMTKHYVDQILICSVYALKLIKAELFKDLDIKFRTMLSACEGLPNFCADKVKKMKSDTGEIIDIITFYNKVYLQPMKVYFKNSCTLSVPVSTSHTPMMHETSPLKAQGIFASSLNYSIPPNFINYTPLLKENNIRKLSTPVTPTTMRLQAHQEMLESPHQSIRQAGQYRRSDKSSSGGSNNPVHLKTLAVLGQLASDQTNGMSSNKQSTRVLNFDGSSGFVNSSREPVTAMSSFGKQSQQQYQSTSNTKDVLFPQSPQQQQQPQNQLLFNSTSPKFGSNSRNSQNYNNSGLEQQNISPSLGAQGQADFDEMLGEERQVLQAQNMASSGRIGMGIKNPNFDSDDENQGEEEQNKNIQNISKNTTTNTSKGQQNDSRPAKTNQE